MGFDLGGANEMLYNLELNLLSNLKVFFKEIDYTNSEQNTRLIQHFANLFESLEERRKLNYDD